MNGEPLPELRCRKSLSCLKTPRRASVRKYANSKVAGLSSSASQSDEFTFEELLNRQWSCFRVSPLFNLKTTQLDLKRASRKIAECFCRPGCDDKNYNVTLIYTGIALQIIIHLMDHPQKPLYIGFLISQAPGDVASFGSTHPLYPSAGHYPLLLSCGLSRIRNLVHPRLEVMYDCWITAMHLRSNELMWLSAIACGCESVTDSKSVEFQYECNYLQKQCKLCFSMKSNEVKALWDRFSNPESEFYQEKNMNGFHNALLLHYFNVFGFNLDTCSITVVKTPSLYADKNGKVQVKSEDVLGSVLEILVDHAKA